MQVRMTIQSFSERTGLPASTLRYYEKEQLLLPEVRADNGYRLYGEEQIPKAVKIHSLRQAGISLTDIRSYLTAGSAEQEQWLQKWREEIDARLSILQVAKQYLYGMEPRNEHVRLVKWDNPQRIIWFRHTVPRRLNPFSEVMLERTAFMKKLDVQVQEAFVSQVRIQQSEMVGKIGFRIRSEGSLPIVTEEHDAEIEVLEPTLFVAMDCLSHDPYACFSLMLNLQKFGFEAIGPNIERHHSGNPLQYELMVPVSYVRRRD